MLLIGRNGSQKAHAQGTSRGRDHGALDGDGDGGGGREAEDPLLSRLRLLHDRGEEVQRLGIGLPQFLEPGQWRGRIRGRGDSCGLATGAHEGRSGESGFSVGSDHKDDVVPVVTRRHECGSGGVEAGLGEMRLSLGFFLGGESAPFLEFAHLLVLDVIEDVAVGGALANRPTVGRPHHQQVKPNGHCCPFAVLAAHRFSGRELFEM